MRKSLSQKIDEPIDDREAENRAGVYYPLCTQNRPILAIAAKPRNAKNAEKSAFFERNAKWLVLLMIPLL